MSILFQSLIFLIFYHFFLSIFLSSKSQNFSFHTSSLFAFLLISSFLSILPLNALSSSVFFLFLSHCFYPPNSFRRIIKCCCIIIFLTNLDMFGNIVNVIYFHKFKYRTFLIWLFNIRLLHSPHFYFSNDDRCYLIWTYIFIIQDLLICVM